MEKKSTHVPYGAITGLIMVVMGLILYFTGLAFKPGMQYMTYIPFIIGIILNANAYSKANNGFVTFGNVFGSCFRATMIIALVMVAWSAISLFAFPEMKVKAMEIAQQEMASKSMSDDQMEKGMEFMKKGYGTMIISFTVFGTLFVGAIFSLIGAAIAKKKGATPFELQQ
ncbi:MAG: DUF4199 domain-containing protein [Bacteroidota bacterium]